MKELFAAQRMEKIKKVMLENKTIDILALCSMLNVSDVTVRKDLDKLEREGFLIKTHGGAILASDQIQEETENTDIENYDLKEKIAELAMTVVEEGDVIFLGPGSTCYVFSKKLKNIKNLTVVTNNINALHELTPYIRNVFLVGGEITYYNGMLYSSGTKALNYIDGIFVNKAFFSVDGIDLMAGFTINEQSRLDVLHRIPSISKRIIVLADYTKFNKIGLYQIGTADFPHCVVSNEKMGDSYKKFFYAKDIKTLTTYDI